MRRQPSEQLPSWLRSLGLAALGLIAITLVVAALVELPRHLVLHDLGSVRLGPSEAAKATNDARATLIQGLGGLALFAGAFFTWRQLRITREGQITDRFTRAVDQLGSDRADVRIGGIYALERIARNSPTDRGPIAEVLSAFVRGRAAWYDAVDRDVPLERLPPLRARLPDVQAAMTVLGRRVNPEQDADYLWLSDVDLRKARLDGACLNGARMNATHLEGAALRGAQLENVMLWSAHLQGAFLTGASLRGAILRSANLRGTDLHDVPLHGAVANGATLWPKGFDPTPFGVQSRDE